MNRRAIRAVAGICCCLTCCVVSAAVSAENLPARDLQLFAQAYQAGDVDRLATLLHDQVEHDGTRGAKAVIEEYGELFQRTRDRTRRVSFRHVRVQQDRLAAWFRVQGASDCSGLMEVRYEGHAWRHWQYICFDQRPVQGGPEVAALADALSTGAVLAQGGAELNPLVQPVTDVAGGAGLLAAKLAMSEAAEGFETATCRGLKSGLTVGGWTAAGFNLGGPVGAAGGLLVGLIANGLTVAGQAENCLGEYGPIDYAAITADTITPYRPDVAVVNSDEVQQGSALTRAPIDHADAWSH